MYAVSEIHEMGKAQNLILLVPVKKAIGVDDVEPLHQDNFDE